MFFTRKKLEIPSAEEALAGREMVDDAWPLMNAVRSGMADLDAVICGKKMEPSRPKGRAALASSQASSQASSRASSRA